MSEVSVLQAAEGALHETQRRLFPIQGHRWLALGFVAFLDQCGRGGVGAPNVPSLSGKEAEEARELLGRVMAYLSSHIGVVVAGVAVVLALYLALRALVVWLQSRGTFMYIDDVETGRSDVRRPWHEHAGRAGSYFMWLFGVE